MTLAPNRSSMRGYSLVELLLTTALLLVFAGLAIVSLKSMSQGANLNEGAIRFEGVLRYARAEAANTGRRVRVNFVQSAGATNQVDIQTTNQLNEIQLTWEPDPFGEPDVFQDLPASQWGVDQVNETVGIESVRLMDDGSQATPSASVADTNADETAMATSATSATTTVPASPTWITFNPDGSCDSAEITLTARDTDDDRRVTMRVEGMTGTISRLPETEPSDSASSSPTATDQPADDMALK